MMPLIQPLPNAYSKPTEYQKERDHVAEMQAELRRRKRFASAPLLRLPSLRTALSRLVGAAMPRGTPPPTGTAMTGPAPRRASKFR